MNHLCTTDEDLLVLRRFAGQFRLDTSAADYLQHAVFAVVVDTETTGTGPSDTLIELAVLPFVFHRNTGALIEVSEAAYCGFQDPGRPIPPAASAVNNITDAMVRGQTVNWAKVLQLLANAEFIIAHNAAFDRPVIQRALAAAGRKMPPRPWVCSMADIDWKQRPGRPPSLALGVLAAWHGFFFDAHRALDDCKATLHLLDLAGVVRDLQARSQNPTYLVVVPKTPYQMADTIKSRGGYRWNPTAKHWWTEVSSFQHAQVELAWMGQMVYGANTNYAEAIAVDPKERFL